MANVIHGNQAFFWCGIDLNWAYTRLLQKIFVKTRCLSTANDVLHDALLHLAISNMRTEVRAPHAYLSGVVENVLVDYYKSGVKYTSLDDPDFSQHLSEIIQQDYAPSPEKLAEVQQRMHALQRILDSLPPRCREVFWLYRIESMTQTDIAQQLGISVNMVERHVMRALVDLSLARHYLLDEY